MVPRLPMSTVEDYVFSSRRDPSHEMPFPEKLKVTEARVARLEETEWQRWIPLLGTYRFFRDLINQDCVLLREVKPISYNVANIVYNISILEATMIAATRII